MAINQRRYQPILSAPTRINQAQIYPETLDLLIATILLIGLLSVASSSFNIYPENFSFEVFFDTSAEIFLRQLVYAILGIGFYLGIAKFITMDFLYHHRFKIFLTCIILLSLVYLPGVGVEINGRKRWVDLLIQFQPSEIAKIGMILFIATFLQSQQKEVIDGAWYVALVKMAIILFFFLLPIILEDLSTSVIYMIIAISMLAMAGYRLSVLFLFASLLLVLAFLMISIFEYRVERLSFLYPWEDLLGTGYQSMQAQVAQEMGGLFGKGYGMSLQKLGMLPVPHNDFIISIMIEEWGMILVLSGVIFFYGSLIYVILQIAKAAFANRQFASSYYCYGVSTWLFFQSSFNLFVNLGVAPVTGLNLPLISFGGTGLVVTLISLALVRRICIELYLPKSKPRALRS